MAKELRKYFLTILWKNKLVVPETIEPVKAYLFNIPQAL